MISRKTIGLLISSFTYTGKKKKGKTGCASLEKYRDTKHCEKNTGLKLGATILVQASP